MHDSVHDPAGLVSVLIPDYWDAIVVVAGSPTFNDYTLFCACLEERLLREDLVDLTDIVFLAGQSGQGADVMIIRWCRENGFRWAHCVHDRSLGRSVTYAHNALLASVGTHLITFWDGVSPGTKDLILQARRQGLVRMTNFVDPDPDWIERTRNKPWQEIVRPQRPSFWSTFRS